MDTHGFRDTQGGSHSAYAPPTCQSNPPSSRKMLAVAWRVFARNDPATSAEARCSTWIHESHQEKAACSAVDADMLRRPIPSSPKPATGARGISWDRLNARRRRPAPGSGRCQAMVGLNVEVAALCRTSAAAAARNAPNARASMPKECAAAHTPLLLNKK